MPVALDGAIPPSTGMAIVDGAYRGLPLLRVPVCDNMGA